MMLLKKEIKNGIFIFLSLGAYFLALDLNGLSDVVMLRLFNAFIVLFFVNKVIKQNIELGKDAYLENFGSGMLTSLIGVLLSIVGLIFYINVFRGAEHLLNLATSVIVMDSNVEIWQYSIALLIEGLASSMIISFILMQYWKSYEKLERA